MGPLTRRVVHVGKRALVVAAYVLPAALVLHAIAFWGHGIVDKEALTFIVNYLAERSLLAMIFDPRLNDWGLYQARELSYVFDFVDARMFAALLDRDILLFVPVSGAVGLISVAAIYLHGARKVLRLDGLTASLLLSLFLSCIVTQASTGILYRSSKIVLSVALLAFLFRLAFLLRAGNGERTRRASGWSLLGLFLLGLVMSVSDRQGFYYLVMATSIVSALWLTSAIRHARPRTNHPRVIVASVAAIAVATLYNNAIAPRIILWTNGYRPDFEYQQLPLLALFNWTLAGQAFVMFRAQVGYLFGNMPFVAVCALSVIYCAGAAWRTQSARTAFSVGALLPGDLLIVSLASSASLVLLIALMILRHPPVFSIPDHSFWYYTLTIHVVLLFGVTLGLNDLSRQGEIWGKSVIWLLLLAMIANNVRHYPEQREIMINSAQWFKSQYAHSQRFLNDFEAMEGRSPWGERSPRSWLRVNPRGAVVELPIQEQGFLDGVLAAHATLTHRGPLADAGGPHWSALRGFLLSPASPLGDPEEMGSVVEAFQSIGVREIQVNQGGYQDPVLAREIIDAMRAATGQPLRWSVDGTTVTFDLSDDRPRLPRRGALRRIPQQSFRATASHAQDRLPLAFDGDADTRWISGSRQTGDEWIQIDFDRARDVGRIRIDLADRSLGDYPRKFLIDSADGGQHRTLYDDSPLGALMKGLLKEPARAPIEIDLPANHSRTLLLRQTGHTRVWFWSIHELTFWER